MFSQASFVIIKSEKIFSYVHEVYWELKNLHEKSDKLIHKAFDIPETRLLVRPLLKVMRIPQLFLIRFMASVHFR